MIHSSGDFAVLRLAPKIYSWCGVGGLVGVGVVGWGFACGVYVCVRVGSGQEEESVCGWW